MPRSLRPEVALARRLRRRMTLPEVMLWSRLRGNTIGVRVRRQHPIGSYVADFRCAVERLVIEVDGEGRGRGDGPRRDRSRDRFLEENGYRVIRVAAADILRDVEATVALIAASVASPLHHSPAASGPPPRAGEE